MEQCLQSGCPKYFICKPNKYYGTLHMRRLKLGHSNEAYIHVPNTPLNHSVFNTGERTDCSPSLADSCLKRTEWRER